ncbi:hypothetical protein GUU_01897 [Malacoplasma iowae 695]|nr:hypothetical protein GUU_01897 [Malacoplasma iowae 695]
MLFLSIDQRIWVVNFDEKYFFNNIFSYFLFSKVKKT